ncbi:MAG: hypothetical protein AAFP69_23860, partial [Planctomycetota bacterium]
CIVPPTRYRIMNRIPPYPISSTMITITLGGRLPASTLDTNGDRVQRIAATIQCDGEMRFMIR